VLATTLKEFAKGQWRPAHMTREEAVERVLDQFKWTVAQTMTVMEVRAEGTACEHRNYPNNAAGTVGMLDGMNDEYIHLRWRLAIVRVALQETLNANRWEVALVWSRAARSHSGFCAVVIHARQQIEVSWRAT
jgi:hypothetical protein